MKIIMTSQKRYLELFQAKIIKMLDITKIKNKDYSTKDPNWDAFKNFKQVEHLWLCNVETGILVRITDKISRISTLIQSDKEPSVKNESIQDTLIDMANYAIIAAIYLDTKNEIPENIQDEIMLLTSKWG